MGTVTDMKQRKSLARVDDEVKRSKVVAAREIIYENNFAVDNVDVEALLKDESLVPTDVSLYRTWSYHVAEIYEIVECFLDQACPTRFRYSLSTGRRPHA